MILTCDDKDNMIFSLNVTVSCYPRLIRELITQILVGWKDGGNSVVSRSGMERGASQYCIADYSTSGRRGGKGTP